MSNDTKTTIVGVIGGVAGVCKLVPQLAPFMFIIDAVVAVAVGLLGYYSNKKDSNPKEP